ncbi:MAG: hypothetical protein PHE24_02375 [Patescibacteria group bacterium]|nr:hypothetical protein [Patescibacteria group bacterium]
MKLFLFCWLFCWPLAVVAAESAGCEPAEQLIGDAICFSIKSATFYGNGKFTEIKLPYFYDSSFHYKNIEVAISLPNGQKMIFTDSLFLLSAINDSCLGTLLEFNLMELEATELDNQKFIPPRKVTRDDIDFLINHPRSYWRLAPKQR